MYLPKYSAPIHGAQNIETIEHLRAYLRLIEDYKHDTEEARSFTTQIGISPRPE